MGNSLIILHAMTAEIGLFAFLWVLVELLSPDAARINRDRIAAGFGLVCLLAAWVMGGYYYFNIYGAGIKPVIKAGDAPWVHSVVMEVKEHVFLFVPVLAAVVFGLISKYGQALIHKRDIRVSICLLAGLIFLLGFAIAGMGVIIASAYRHALEAGLT